MTHFHFNSPIQILLVEDDPDDILIFSDMMKEKTEISFPYEIHEATSLNNALEKLEKNYFDIVLLDLSLPDSQGIDTFIKIQQKFSSIPIVLLTGLNDQNAALDALSAGAQDYLIKGSFNSRALKRVISYSIERNHLLKKIEQSSEERFRHLIENDSDGMVVIDNDGIVKFANPASLNILALQENEIIEKPFHYPFQADSLNEIEMLSPNGKTKIIEMRITNIEWAKEPAYLASIHDITETREVEKLKAEIVERKKLDQLKDNFVSIVSHEIKTPLTIIKAALSNMEAGINGPLSEKQKEVLNTTLRNVDRLNRILRDILDLSRFESGRAVINWQNIQIESLINEVKEAYLKEALEKKLDLQFNISPHLPPIETDPDMILQVLNNLLNNAIRYAQSKIIVNAELIESPGNQSIQITIVDDGKGIPDEKIHLLFKKFEQINRPSGGAGYKGTGLGLAICKQIIDLLHGKIWANCSLNKKTEFHILLPCKQPKSGEQSIPNNTLNKKTILIAEDEEDLAESIKTFLEKENYYCDTVQKGIQVLEYVYSHAPDLILLDYIIPSGTGDSILGVLKNDPIASSIPVIAMSAHLEGNTKELFIQKGAAAFLEKPFSYEYLLKVIKTVL